MSTAGRLEEALRGVLRGPLPVRLRLWDGSEAGPTDAPRVVIHSPEALSRLLWQPGELGAAQAYVTGELDLEGDLGVALDHVRETLAHRGVRGIPIRATAVAMRSFRR